MILKIGHRGARGYEPENTLISFKKAIELGADIVELDVHLSKDNELIVIHDNTLNRTTNCRGKIDHRTLFEIKRCRTIKKNQPIPTLKEVLEELEGKIKIDIEIKGKKLAEKVAQLVKTTKKEREVLISSSNVKSLQVVKEMIPEVRTALIYLSLKKPFWGKIVGLLALLLFPLTKMIIIKKARLSRADEVNLFFLFAAKDLINKLHQKGYKVNVWPVNHPFFIKKMAQRGVDGIVSGYPDRLQNINA